jgi:beta-xylosidase
VLAHLRRIAALLMLLLVAALAGCGGDDEEASDRSTPAPTGATAAEEPGDLQPVIDQDFPDPDTILVGDTYYAYATNAVGKNVQVASSKDLKTWEVLDQDALPQLPGWATAGRTWAPEVFALEGGKGYVMWFTARNVEPDLQCIGAATATRPEGPFTPVRVARAPICPANEGGAIDAASFVDRDGARYLLWKNDGNCCGKDTWIYLQALSPDGTRVTGPARRLIKQDQDWEGKLVEAPTLVRQGATYVLLYSANFYGDGSYATGYATAPSIAGPYRKAPEPLLSTEGLDERVTGPGGQDVLVDREGRQHLVFHDWDEATIYRGMHVAALTWQGARPVVRLPGQESR